MQHLRTQPATQQGGWPGHKACLARVSSTSRLSSHARSTDTRRASASALHSTGMVECLPGLVHKERSRRQLQNTWCSHPDALTYHSCQQDLNGLYRVRKAAAAVAEYLVQPPGSAPERRLRAARRQRRGRRPNQQRRSHRRSAGHG